jgi:hypothetical protein
MTILDLLGLYYRALGLAGGPPPVKEHVKVLDGLTDLLAVRGLGMLVTAPDLL